MEKSWNSVFRFLWEPCADFVGTYSLQEACCISQHLSFACLNQLQMLPFMHPYLFNVPLHSFIFYISLFQESNLLHFLSLYLASLPSNNLLYRTLSHPYIFFTFDKMTLFTNFIHIVVFLFACTIPKRILSIPSPPSLS